MDKPTCEELMEMDSVYREADDSWRHGSYVDEVFHRTYDDTFWNASYCLSYDGETNELREGVAGIEQVTPVEKTVVKYIRVVEETADNG